MANFRSWWLAGRPKTLIASTAPVVLSWACLDFQRPVIFLLAWLAALDLQLLSNLVNDYADGKSGVDNHSRIGPVRVLAAGLVTESELLGTIKLLTGVAVLLGAFLVLQGGWPILAIGVFSILFAYLYSSGRWSVSHLGAGELFAFIFFGPVASQGMAWLLTQSWSWSTFWIGLATGCWSMSLLLANNIRDIDSDAQAGKRTLVVRLGAQFGEQLLRLTVLVAYLIPCCAVALNCWPIPAVSVSLLTPITVVGLKRDLTTFDRKALLGRVAVGLTQYTVVLFIILAIFR